LNTHTKGAFFDAETARAVLSRLEFHYTPKHGSWLNIAENELSSMTRQCLKDRRFGMIEELRKEIIAWHSAIHHRQRGVHWQFRINDARVKLRTVYPKIVM
jgi:DDE superfamily endonuclease